MKILALEFSTLLRSAALIEDGDVVASESETARRGGSPFPLIQRALCNAAPDALAVGLGPGSYTGIRSALAIAQGWNLAKKTLCSGTSSAEAIAFEAWSQKMRGDVEVTIDAQRGEIYSVVYVISDEGFTQVEGLEIRRTPRGRGTLIGPDCGTSIFPTARAVGLMAERSRDFVSPEALEAIYLRETTFVKAPSSRHF
jgi:tRNA threonylcarbamoyladenosine biosynthesis protein TsaB